MKNLYYRETENQRLETSPLASLLPTFAPNSLKNCCKHIYVNRKIHILKAHLRSFSFFICCSQLSFCVSEIECKLIKQFDIRVQLFINYNLKFLNTDHMPLF